MHEMNQIIVRRSPETVELPLDKWIIMIYIDDKVYSPDYLINPAIIFIPIFICLLIIRIRKAFQQHINVKKEFLIFSFLYYLYRMSALTIFPIFWFTTRDALPPYGQALFFERSPFLLYSNFNYYSLYHIIGNILLLFPMGFYMGIFIRNYNGKRNIAAIFLVSLTIEIIQLLMSFFYLGNRLFDINDLLFNTIGGIAGYLLYLSPIGQYISNLYAK